MILKAGPHKGKTVNRIKQLDPWYLREMSKADPETWRSLNAKQKQYIKGLVFHYEDDRQTIERVYELLKSGYTTSEIHEMAPNEPLLKDLGMMALRRYAKLARNKHDISLEKEQRELIGVHTQRYELMYKERAEFTPPTNLEDHVRKAMLIDARYLAAEILHAKEKLYGMHSKAYSNRIKKSIEEEHKKNSTRFEKQLNTSHLTTAELRELISIFELTNVLKKDETAEHFERMGEFNYRRDDSMVDWQEIEREQDYVEENTIEVDYEDVTTPGAVNLIELKKPPAQVEPKDLQQVEQKLYDKSKNKLIENLNRARKQKLLANLKKQK